MTVQIWALFDWPVGTWRCAVASRPPRAVRGKGPRLDRPKRLRNTERPERIRVPRLPSTAHTQRNDQGSLWIHTNRLSRLRSPISMSTFELAFRRAQPPSRPANLKNSCRHYAGGQGAGNILRRVSRNSTAINMPASETGAPGHTCRMPLCPGARAPTARTETSLDPRSWTPGQTPVTSAKRCFLVFPPLSLFRRRRDGGTAGRAKSNPAP